MLGNIGEKDSPLQALLWLENRLVPGFNLQVKSSQLVSISKNVQVKNWRDLTISAIFMEKRRMK